MLLNCGVREGFCPFLGQQGDPTEIVKEISLEYLLEGLMLKLKLQYFGYLMQRTGKDQFFSVEKTLMLGKMKVAGDGHNRG